MLDATLTAQLQQYLGMLRQPIRLIASLDDSEASAQTRELLLQIGALSDRVAVAFDGEDARRPSFVVAREGESHGVRFAGLPLGHEFTSLVLALLWTGGHPPKVEPAVLDAIRALDGEHQFDVYMSLSCHNCPDVVQALTLMAVFNPRVQTVVIEGGTFQQEVQGRDIMAVPSIWRNGQSFASGRMSVEEILARLDSGAAARDAARLDAREPYDMLIVGGGPAGAAAAVYAARKGIRVGIAAERLGGQVNDTLGIENYPSVLATDGPKFAAALEAQVRHYQVDVMNLQRADSLLPAPAPGGLVQVRMQGGGTLRARSVVLATGARWRQLGVPGEETYRNKGVAYCPHCDGPLFKGKRVAVIGGGNSGVEAAIDLAGIVAQVTLFEYADQLKADAVLVSRLRSLPNVQIITGAQTTEVLGDGQRVSGLAWLDRATQQAQQIALEGVFVQIGLVPNTEWLRGTLELNRFGEIVVDHHGATSVAGVFAAGDCTTVPYKQIVIAAGDGARAALGAFDHLIRQPVAPAADSAAAPAVAANDGPAEAKPALAA